MSDLTEEQEKAIRDFNAASSKLAKSGGGSAGSGAEKAYGIAYNKMVALGLAPKLRKKYQSGL